MITIQKIDTSDLLTNAIVTAHTWEGELSDDAGNAIPGPAEAAFLALKEGRLEIGNPQGFVQRLKLADFQKQNIALSADIKHDMEQKNGSAYYLVPVPLLLFPSRGAQYRLLELQLTFACDSGTPSIHSIFPEPAWKEVMEWGGKLDLTLDAGLEWGVTVDKSKAEIGKLGGKLAGRVNTKDSIAGHLRVGAFEYKLGHMDIEAQASDDTAMWRLDSPEAIRDQKQLRVLTVLKVPTDTRQIRIEAAAQAQIEFSWLTAQIQHVFPRLAQGFQDMILNKKPLPLQDFQTWTVTLPD